MIALRVVKGMTSHFAGRWPEWVLAILLFAMGCKLLSPTEVFQSSPGFRSMTEFGTETQWGFFLVSIGGVRILALAINGTFSCLARWTPIARAAFALLSGFAWFSIAIGLYVSNPTSWAHLTYSALLVMDILNAIFASGDAGATERKYRNARTG